MRWSMAYSKVLMCHLREDGDVEKELQVLSRHRPLCCLHNNTSSAPFTPLHSRVALACLSAMHSGHEAGEPHIGLHLALPFHGQARLPLLPFKWAVSESAYCPLSLAIAFCSHCLLPSVLQGTHTGAQIEVTYCPCTAISRYLLSLPLPIPYLFVQCRESCPQMSCLSLWPPSTGQTMW